MRHRLLYTIVHSLVLAVLLVASPARGQDREAEIRSLLESRDAEIKRLLGLEDADIDQARREQLRTVINEVIDFDAMSRGALGTHWDGLTPEQRSGFVNVFSAIIRGQSLSNLDPYRAPVTYESFEVFDRTARVMTSTVYRDVPMEVTYDMSMGPDGWRITDIHVDNVSTVEGYARSFQTMVRRRGFDTLMERLRTKLAEVEAVG